MPAGGIIGLWQGATMGANNTAQGFGKFANTMGTIGPYIIIGGLVLVGGALVIFAMNSGKILDTASNFSPGGIAKAAL